MKQINSLKIQTKLRNKFIKHGIKMIGPETIFCSEDTKIGKNVTIDPCRAVLNLDGTVVLPLAKLVEGGVDVSGL